MEKGMFQVTQSSSVSGTKILVFFSRTLPANIMPGPLWKVFIPVSLKLHENDQEHAAMNHSPALTWDS